MATGASLSDLVHAKTSFIDSSIVAQWEQWADGEAMKLTDIPVCDRPTQALLSLPVCKGGHEPIAVTRPAQIELVTWQDSEDPSRGLTMTNKQQSALDRRVINIDNMQVGHACLFAPSILQQTTTDENMKRLDY